MNSSDKIMASPDGALSFLFGIFALLIWYTTTHYPSQSELLTAGGLWLILSLGAEGASLLNMARGKIRGNINLLSSLLLGFFPGVNALVTLAAVRFGFPYTPRAIGLVYIIGACFFAGMFVLRMDRAAYRSLGTLAAALGMFLLGLGDVLGLRQLQTAGGWCCLIFAFYIFYYGLSVMYLFMGSHLPQGPSLRAPTKGKRNDAYKLDEEFENAPHAHLQNFSSPAMILAFISAVFGLLNFFSALYTMPLDEELAMGVIRLLLGSIHFLAAMVILFQGNHLGNITLISAVCFALFSGGRKVMNVLEQYIPVSSVSEMYGMLQLFAGLYIACFLPAMRKLPVYQLVTYWLSALGLMGFGLSELLGMDWLSVGSGFLFLLFSVLNIYKGISAMLPALPQGPMRE